MLDEHEGDVEAMKTLGRVKVAIEIA